MTCRVPYAFMPTLRRDGRVSTCGIVFSVQSCRSGPRTAGDGCATQDHEKRMARTRRPRPHKLLQVINYFFLLALKLVWTLPPRNSMFPLAASAYLPVGSSSRYLLKASTVPGTAMGLPVLS